MMTPPFPTLFSPLKVGPRTVKNRICCSAHAEAMAVDGMPGERTVRYYELKARGGVGFIMCFGSASVHPSSPGSDWNGVELFDDRGWAVLATEKLDLLDRIAVLDGDETSLARVAAARSVRG